MRKRAQDRIGEHHGLLEIRDWKSEDNRTYFYCRCECGSEKWIRGDQVISGRITSCGCQGKKLAKDRIGEQHGLLEIRDWKREGDRTYFYCRCECGKEKWIRADLVIDGTTTSCGCRATETQFKPVDLTGQSFGRLKAIRPTEKRDKYNGNVIWLCECRCGKMVEVAESRLITEEVRSCGCLAKETQRQSIKKANQKRAEAFLVEGTDLLVIKRKKPIKSNQSGVTGVYFDILKQKWRAQIGFQGKSISLGSFNTMEEAIKARKDGEALYFAPVLNKYEQGEALLNGTQKTDKENPASSEKYTQQELIQNLKELAEKLGRTPKSTEMTYPSIGTYNKRFGSWNNALRAAGLELHHQTKPKKIPSAGKNLETDQKRKQKIQQQFEQYIQSGRPLSYHKYNQYAEEKNLPNAGIVIRAYGQKGWRGLLDHLENSDDPGIRGFIQQARETVIPQKHSKRYTGEEIKEKLLTKAKDKGRALVSKEINNDPELPALQTIKQYFGKNTMEEVWQELLNENPDSTLVIKTKEEQCREAFLKWVSEQDGPITSTKYDQDSRGNPELPTLRKIWRALGVSSWNELLNALEVTQNRKEGQRKSVIKTT
ncbi:homing endonuclease associated repeat-containing protein [Eubacterium sp.]|uniref:homing endonuclease associated repeat-containing protein n=1 Tax=Eubacterium sp. TaxID=142586 RepID=UPI0026E00A42|nr:AP2 domain-containing protein [Eubacterium sp.]MDO5432918.1 AP2 domain-containing protein [Eubacterium sp.]